MHQKNQQFTDMATSLRDISKHFKVNVSTVSRALADDSRISYKIKNEIKSYAEQIGYKPSPLRRKIKNALALIMYTGEEGKTDDYYQLEIIRRFSLIVSRHKKNISLEFLKRDESGTIPSAILENRVDGLLIAGHPPLTLCHLIQKEKLPAVILSDSLERTGCFCIRPDFRSGTTEAVKHLINSGRKRLAFVLSNPDFPTVRTRYDAFCQALLENSLIPESKWILDNLSPDMKGGRTAVQKLLKLEERPDSIVFINDYMATGAIMELQKNGIRVPEDISVTGHDNTIIASELSPALSSVESNLEEMLEGAYKMICTQIKDKNIEPIERLFKTKFVRRESS